MGWKRGLNFSRAKYTEIDNYTYIPHIRPDRTASIPKSILENFNINNKKDLVSLVEITDKDNNKTMRIKKLKSDGNSLKISLKAEYKSSPKIKVISVKPQSMLLKREKIFSSNKIVVNALTPKLTNNGENSTPIYSFDYGNKMVIGGYYKKDLLVNKEIDLRNKSLEALVLYFSDGGKVAASFTNSSPSAINSVLSFLEENFGWCRERVKGTIYCHPNLLNKKKQLEEFWSKETSVENFTNLHLGRNSRSPCGTLELQFSSIVLKEIIVSILNNLIYYNFDKNPVIRGVLSGDGSPIIQTKYSITHHLASDKKPKSLDFIKNIFCNYKIGIIPTQPKITIYTSWEENKGLLFIDPYKFNLLNRLKFAHGFLCLPKTLKLFDKQLTEFKHKNYDNILNDLVNHYKNLISFGLLEENKIELIKNAYSLH